MKNLKLIFLLVVVPVFFQSCKDDDGVNPDDIIGIWTADDVNVDVAVNELELTKYLTEQAGYSAQEAALFKGLAMTAYEAAFAGFTVEFKSDNTYEINIPNEDNETGPYTVNSNVTVLTIDARTNDETIITIKSLGSNTLVLLFQDEETDDLNDDGTNENLKITTTLTLTK
jgi:hypothetical protein